MIDVHCHLNFHAFKDDVEQVVEDAKKVGITHIVNVGTKIDSSQEAVNLAELFDDCYAVVGIHPHHADKVESGWEKELDKIARSSKKVIGIGECGLDYYSYKSNEIVDPKVQQTVFEAQIELAHRLNLPLQIHNRHAGKDIVKILEHHKNLLLNPPGMFHCMSGDLAFLQQVLDLGFYAGFDGNITYPGVSKGETVKLSDLVKATPLDRILVETDSPFLTPEPYRGSRNSPKNAIIVAEYIASLKDISYTTLKEAVYTNFASVFHKIR